MNRSAIVRWAVVLTTVALTIAFLLLPGLGAVGTASAQDQVPAVETTVTEVPTATPTNTPAPTSTATPTPPPGSTNTPTRIATLPPDTPTPNPTATPTPSGPVPIPEPVTVVLFGTGLAALSAALASRRKTEE